MRNFVIVSEKKWNKNLKEKLEKVFPNDKWFLINKKNDLTKESLDSFKADKVFIPHWSYIIPASVYNNFECVVFHMTDLPYGRGGSPLQNLIVRGHKKTKVSALRVEKGLDEGPIYLKKELELNGTAEEIYFRVNNIIFEMICSIIELNLKPKEQTGEVVVFKRRPPEMSNLHDAKTLEEVYDKIRMLDAEGYPHAFLETEYMKIEFTKAKQNDNEIIANVRITKK